MAVPPISRSVTQAMICSAQSCTSCATTIESAVNQAKAAAAGNSGSPVGSTSGHRRRTRTGSATVTRPRRVALFFMSLGGLQVQG